MECTINGIGERAGNTSLEEVVMGILLHKDYYDAHTSIDTRQIYETSRIVSATMGLDLQVNKAITGENAFAHSSGIHQDGLLKSKDVYEIMDPETIGAPAMEIVLTARSGRHAFKHVSQRLGFELPEASFEGIYQQFLSMADSKKEIYDTDVLALLKKTAPSDHPASPDLWQLLDYQLQVDGDTVLANVNLSKGDQLINRNQRAQGIVNALYGAIIEACGQAVELIDYRINNLGRGQESMGKVTVQIRCQDQFFSGKAIEQDVMQASALALVNAINKTCLAAV